MNESLLALGVSHKTAPVALRERLALPEGRAARIIGDLTSRPEIHEAVAISTCNRTELYLVAADPVEAENLALAELSRQAGIRPTELLGRLYSLRGDDAVRHLFSVAAGLESMIVGEAEVQGQVKRAYELALVEGAHRADLEPALPRRARRRQARAHGDRARPLARIGVVGCRRPRARRAGRPGDPARARDRRRRERRAHRQGARRPRRAHGVRREPAL